MSAIGTTFRAAGTRRHHTTEQRPFWPIFFSPRTVSHWTTCFFNRTIIFFLHLNEKCKRVLDGGKPFVMLSFYCATLKQHTCGSKEEEDDEDAGNFDFAHLWRKKEALKIFEQLDR